MTETKSGSTGSAAGGKGLSGMLLPELKQLAQQMGISGASAMRKGDLVTAIGDRQRPAAAAPAAERSTTASERPRRSARRDQAPAETTAAEPSAPAASAEASAWLSW